MDVPPYRYTLMETSTVSGMGIHTGETATVHLHPAKPGHGIVFRTGKTEIPARAEYVVDTSRCTVLGKDGERISTVEHFLSTCAGWGVTDLLIEVEGPEMPIGDGSSALWTEIFEGNCWDIGTLQTQRVTKPVVVTGKGGAFVAIYPARDLSVTTAITFDHPLVGTQVARYDLYSSDLNYRTAIAPARTFGFIEEVEALLAAGLAKGGSFDNAVVIYPDHFSTPLRFDNELARHKLLDLMGDLLLWNGQSLPVADIIAVKPSHRLNTEAAKAIAALAESE